jgi:gliding motility-associated-like protein
VTTSNNCTANGKITVKVIRNLHMPNAFNPGASVKNSIFRIPPNTSLTLKYFSVYNRWDGRIFFTTDASIGWDGSFDGNPCEQGAYVYYIVGSDNQGPSIQREMLYLSDNLCGGDVGVIYLRIN